MELMQLEWLRLYLPLLGLVVQPLVLWAIWSLRKEFVLKKDCETCRSALEKEDAKQAHRITRTEDILAAMPDAQALHDLALLIERLSGDVRTLGERVGGYGQIMERVEKVVARHENYLLHNNGR